MELLFKGVAPVSRGSFWATLVPSRPADAYVRAHLGNAMHGLHLDIRRRAGQWQIRQATCLPFSRWDPEPLSQHGGALILCSSDPEQPQIFLLDLRACSRHLIKTLGDQKRDLVMDWAPMPRAWSSVYALNRRPQTDHSPDAASLMLVDACSHRVISEWRAADFLADSSETIGRHATMQHGQIQWVPNGKHLVPLSQGCAHLVFQAQQCYCGMMSGAAARSALQSGILALFVRN